MQKEYYKEYYHYEREHWFFRARNKIITSHIESLIKQNGMEGKELSILNVGVATGYTSVLLKQFGKVTSIEYDEDCFEFTNSNVPDIGLQLGSILELDFEDGQFDFVCAFDVVEHVEDDKTAVSELQRVCSEEGHVVITVPAFMSLWSNHDVINHHFKRYKLDQIKNLFSKKEKIVYASYFNFWLFLPVYLFRKINNVLGISSKSAKDDQVSSDLVVMSKDGIITRFLYRLFASETGMILKRRVLPFGVSILTSWKK